jgi:hypothetical protein
LSTKAAVLVFAFLAMSPLARAADVQERTVVLQTPRGVSQPILLTIPADTVKGIVLLFPGGNGVLALTDQGPTKGLDNFVVRTRQLYAQAGLVSCLVDVPSDHKDGITDYRASASAATDAGAIISWLRSNWGAPIWAVGTSRGTVSAANVTARLGPQGPSALVMSSSVTAGALPTLDDVALEQVRVPSLVMENQDDACVASPPAGVQKVISRLAQPTSQLFHGGLPPMTGPCDGLSYHGFYGLEDEVVSETIKFLL